MSCYNTYQLTTELAKSEKLSSLQVELEEAVLVLVKGVPVGETDVESDMGVSDCGFGMTALPHVSSCWEIHCACNFAASLNTTVFTVTSDNTSTAYNSVFKRQLTK